MSEIIPHWLTKQAFLAPERTAVELEDGTKLTFKQLRDKSQMFARKLSEHGVEKGNHIGILSNNNIHMVIAIHALSYLGAVAVMLNTRLTTSELNYQIKDAEVSTVLTSDFLYEKATLLDSENIASFSEINRQKEKEVKLKTEINLEDTFTIIYTSGTTGFPKGVVHTYGNHWWSSVGSMLNLGLNENDKWLAMLPIFHVGGLSILIRSVVYGMPVYLMEKFNVQAVHNAIMEKGITIVSVVTVMVQRLMDYIGDQYYPNTLRCMLLGGGPAPKPLLEKAKEKGIPVFQSYGMTETSSQIVTLSPSDALEKIGSAGKPLSPAQLEIKGKEPNEIGEIIVKGPMVTKRYWKNEEATKQSINNGWLATGDLGFVDEDGFLFVVDRRKDLIISGGENVYPSEIESVLSGLKHVQEVGVVGMKDNTWGQVPVAFIVTDGEKVTEKDILDDARNYLASYKLPKHIYFVEQLPRNASNKLVRNKLAEWLEKQDKQS